MRIQPRTLALSALVIGTTIATTLDAQTGQRPPRDSAPRAGVQQPGIRREMIEERVIRGRTPDARGPEGRGPRGAQRRPGRGNPAAMLLGLRAQLGLSDEQVKRLEALRDAPLPKPNTAEMLRSRADLLEATQGDGNLTAARAALDKMSRLRTEQALAGLKARQDARAVLTPAQKTKLDGMRQQMAGRVRKALRNRALRGRAGGEFRGRGAQPGFGAPMQGPQIRRRVIEGPGGEERVIEERIIRAPGGGAPNGPDGPVMLRRGGRPPVPPAAPVAPDSVR